MCIRDSGLIARMDSDDVCLPQRFERQMQFIADHPEIDVLGASISEFDSDPKVCMSDVYKRQVGTNWDARNLR